MHYIVDYHLVCIYGVQAGLVHFRTIHSFVNNVNFYFIKGKD